MGLIKILVYKTFFAKERALEHSILIRNYANHFQKNIKRLGKKIEELEKLINK